MRTFLSAVILIWLILSLALASEYYELNVFDFLDVPESTFDSLDSVTSSKIVNGKPMEIEEMPFLVWLEREKKQRCGGSLVTPNHVMTAAHCTSKYKAEDWTINSGGTLRDKPLIVRKVKNVTIHPNYKEDGSYDYDIAIMVLDAKIPNTKTIQLAKETPKDNSTVRIAGWGDLSEDAIVFGSNQLLFVDVSVVNRDRCQDIIGKYGTITTRMFCAYEEGKDSCTGDSGGPVVDKDGHLSGIVSWGFGCARKGVPGIYTDVPAFNNWIKSIVPDIY